MVNTFSDYCLFVMGIVETNVLEILVINLKCAKSEM
jgi:hypothetical protein